MKFSLQVEIKEAIGYTASPPSTCRHCVHFHLRDSGKADSPGIEECLLFHETLGALPVDLEGACNKFLKVVQ